ncbi:uncharacterized protein LOC141907756 [Tubulanus polymorphus]|uniref:uncharacterized protein LOC141907756 n=1 Tax=Tubulanus polymorphus TaxID=672921 RepID=UPI003DA25A52
MFTSSNNSILLKTAVVSVFVPSVENSCASANLVFDDGSQRSFISQDLATSLDLKPIRREIIELSGFGAETSECRAMDVVNLAIQCRTEIVTVELIVTDTIASTLRNSSVNRAKDCPHLIGLDLAHPPSSMSGIFVIQMLIGADQYYKLVEGELIKGPFESDPIAVKTKVGYVLSGPVHNDSHTSTVLSMLTIVRSHSSDNAKLQKFWEIQILTDTNDSDTLDFMHRYNSTITRNQTSRYIAPLPWKDDFDTLPSNFNVSNARTRSTARRLAKDPPMLKLYSDLINDQRARDFIEEIPPDEIDANNL